MKTNCKLSVIYAILCMLFVFEFSGCKKESKAPSEDDTRIQNIAGSWRSDQSFEKITFLPNLEFIDSIFCSGFYPASLVRVQHGKYNIKDGYLIFTDVSLSYLAGYSDTTQQSCYFYTYPYHKIEYLDHMNLTLIPTLIFQSNNIKQPNSLYSQWRTTMLLSAFDHMQVPHFVNGYMNQEYEFHQDTSLYDIYQFYQAGADTFHDYSDSIPYEFILPDRLIIWNEDRTIFFMNNSMFWEFKPNTFSFENLKL